MARARKTVRARRQSSKGGLPRWWPFAAAGLLLRVLCPAWLALPLHRWIDEPQSRLLGLGAAGIGIFAGVVSHRIKPKFS
jgi:hypothetical protein